MAINILSKRESTLAANAAEAAASNQAIQNRIFESIKVAKTIATSNANASEQAVKDLEANNQRRAEETATINEAFANKTAAEIIISEQQQNVDMIAQNEVRSTFDRAGTIGLVSDLFVELQSDFADVSALSEEQSDIMDTEHKGLLGKIFGSTINQYKAEKLQPRLDAARTEAADTATELNAISAGSEHLAAVNNLNKQNITTGTIAAQSTRISKLAAIEAGERNLAAIQSNGIAMSQAASMRGQALQDQVAITKLDQSVLEVISRKARDEIAIDANKISRERLALQVQESEMKEIRFKTRDQTLARIAELSEAEEQRSVAREERAVRKAAGDETQQDKDNESRAKKQAIADEGLRMALERHAANKVATADAEVRAKATDASLKVEAERRDRMEKFAIDKQNNVLTQQQILNNRADVNATQQATRIEMEVGRNDAAKVERDRILDTRVQQAAAMNEGEAMVGAALSTPEMAIAALNSRHDATFDRANVLIDISTTGKIGIDAGDAIKNMKIIFANGGEPDNRNTRMLARIAEETERNFTATKSRPNARQPELLAAAHNNSAEVIAIRDAKEIRVGDRDNMYAAPPMASIAEFASVQEERLYTEVLKELNMSEVDPQVMVDYGIAAVQKGVITPAEFESGMLAIFTAGATINKTNEGGGRRIGVKDQTSAIYSIKRGASTREAIGDNIGGVLSSIFDSPRGIDLLNLPAADARIEASRKEAEASSQRYTLYDLMNAQSIKLMTSTLINGTGIVADRNAVPPVKKAP